MVTHRRSATYVSTLVYVDEPQVVLLLAGPTFVVANAIPAAQESKALFLGTSVKKRDWESYQDGAVDLRYLFTYPTMRTLYSFDFFKMNKDKVLMERLETDPPDEWLPEPRFFSRSHTEDDHEAVVAPGTEQLSIDGEWDMPEFGDFYNRYSDVYYFVSAAGTFASQNVSQERLRQIKDAFTDHPFKGGFSYVHLYDELVAARSRGERLRLDKTKYESPGYVKIHGDQGVFSDLEHIIMEFISHRTEIKRAYSEFYNYLSKNGYLKLAGTNYNQRDPATKYMMGQSVQLARMMHMPHAETVLTLVDDNALVYAKIILSFYRRLEDAARYFAQGRVEFT